ncbi:MAG: ATP-binding protein [Gammaproteobacteria bacterium]
MGSVRVGGDCTPVSYQTELTLRASAGRECVHHGFRKDQASLELRVLAEPQHDMLVLSVTDNGRGIPPERLVFLSLQRVVSNRGTGTALYQLRQSLQLTFGPKAQLLVESQLGAGTKATLVLPHRETVW